MERYFKRKERSPDNSIDTGESVCGSGFDRTVESSNEQPQPVTVDYRTRLNEFVKCIRFILRQGFPLCGLEYETERREEDFTSLLELSDSYKYPNGVLPLNAAEGLPVAAADIQEDLFRAAATETTKAIIEDLGEDYFGIHLAGFFDIKYNQVLAVVLRYVDKGGIVKERSIGIVKLMVYSGSLFKTAFDSLLSQHGLRLSRIRGLSYDGGSHFYGDFNEVKDLIIGENKSAYLTHCSAKQLHSTLVQRLDVSDCGKVISDILKLVGVRCEHREGLEKKDKETAIILQVLTNGELSAEELHKFSLKVRNTRWGFNYELLCKFVSVFFSVIEVLFFIENEASNPYDKCKANLLLRSLDTFNFVFHLHFMKSVLGVTNELSLALEKKDLDVATVVVLAIDCKQQLQTMKDEGWEALLAEVTAYCQKYDFDVPHMDQNYICSKRWQVTNLHHYRDKIFCGMIDSQLKELNHLFSQVTIELLLCSSCLNPSNSFRAFDKQKLVRLAQYYPEEFSNTDWLALECQLDNCILDMRTDRRFSNLNSLPELSAMLVNTKKHNVYTWVYLLIKLVLLLPITAPAEERAVSAMKLIETKLSEQICDSFMIDSLVTYIERDVFGGITNDALMDSFERLKKGD